MFRRKSGYSPPDSYWEEVDRLDDDILGLSERAPFRRKLGPIPLRTNRALWSGKDEKGGSYWERCHVLWGAGVSCLWVAEIIAIDPAAEGITTEDNEISDGFYGKCFNYVTGRNANVRALRVDYASSTDALYPELPARTAESRSLTKQLGLTTPGEEAFEELLGELRRGASGEFTLSFSQERDSD